MSQTNASHRSASWDTVVASDGTGPTLTVIVVSLGTRQDLERAVRLVAPAIHSLRAQLIVVRRSPEPALEFSLADVGRVEVVRASADIGRSEMLALGMRAARGDIIAVRDDISVQDAQWLAGYRQACELRSDTLRSLPGPADARSEAPPAL